MVLPGGAELLTQFSPRLSVGVKLVHGGDLVRPVEAANQVKAGVVPIVYGGAGAECCRQTRTRAPAHQVQGEDLCR